MHVVRAYLRHRAMSVEHRAAHIQHLQKALHQTNSPLTQVLSDITGTTGWRGFGIGAVRVARRTSILLPHRIPFRERSAADNEQQARERQIAAMRTRAARLGFPLVESPA
jgi:hypothetical protein